MPVVNPVTADKKKFKVDDWKNYATVYLNAIAKVIKPELTSYILACGAYKSTMKQKERFKIKRKDIIPAELLIELMCYHSKMMRFDAHRFSTDDEVMRIIESYLKHYRESNLHNFHHAAEGCNEFYEINTYKTMSYD